MNDLAYLRAREEVGDSFYLLSLDRFRENLSDLTAAFREIYPRFALAYSYKTNYIPALCRAAREAGALAEVVSTMELSLAEGVGNPPSCILWNGPYKPPEDAARFLLSGGTLNLDSPREIALVRELARSHPSSRLRVGVRCNFALPGKVQPSRFGLDIDSPEFSRALSLPREFPSVTLRCLHCHYPDRDLASWRARAEAMIALVQERDLRPEIIDLGGGLFGRMPPSLAAQFAGGVPTFADYARAVASPFAQAFPEGGGYRPTLVLEPGTALAADCMEFAATVLDVKTVHGRAIAQTSGSVYDINPTQGRINPPYRVIRADPRAPARICDRLDIAGFTCIEHDILAHGVTATLAPGDLLVFRNVGSYSVTMTPPFILPAFPILAEERGEIRLLRRAQTPADIFAGYEV